MDGSVSALVEWDPDEDGPQSPLIVVGGHFRFAGAVAANYIAAYDPATREWSALGDGLNSSVQALVVLPRGRLIAAGHFWMSGEQPVRSLARWTGTEWVEFAGGTDGNVQAMAVLPGGELAIGGDFHHAGGVPAEDIAMWDGDSWSPFGTGMSTEPNSTVRALELLLNGDLVAAGDFLGAGGVLLENIARWDGAQWHALAEGIDEGAGASNSVKALLCLPNGDLLAGGFFNKAGTVTAHRLARWDGVAWSALPYLGCCSVNSLVRLPDGEFAAGGTFSQAFDMLPVNGIARWTGTGWAAYGTGFGGASQGENVEAMLVTPNGELLVGGSFVTAGGASAHSVARWDGGAWHPFSDGWDDDVRALMVHSSGDVIIGGSFLTVDGVSATRIARWNGIEWSALGSGMNEDVETLAELPNGDIVAGGAFTSAGGVAAARVARWDGASWHPLGSGIAGNSFTRVWSLLALPNGDLVVGGYFTVAGGETANRIARWDGNAWSPMGGGMSSVVGALGLMPNGDIVAGGVFSSAEGQTAYGLVRWDGVSWATIGGGLNPGGFVEDLVVLPNGDLVVVGGFTSAGGVPAINIARWDGASWSSYESGANNAIWRIASLPSGDLVAGGPFTFMGGGAARRLARWDGFKWSAIGAGPDNSVRELAVHPDGVLWVGGDFKQNNGVLSPYIARYEFLGLPPGTRVQPASRAVCDSDGLAITVDVSGFGPFGFQWRANGVPIDTLENPSALSPTLEISSAQFGDGGAYDCVVTYPCGELIAGTANLSVLLAGDSNADSVVDFGDIVETLGAWLQSGAPGAVVGDANCDGIVDFTDIVTVLANWLDSAP